ncbi:MAG: cytochrome c [Syntrophobacteria bacterium]|jgi:cytochrome c556
MKGMWKTVVCFAIVAGIIGTAYAQFARTDDAIKYRQAVMFLIGQHMGRMAAVVKGKQPHNREDFAQNAALVETLSKLSWNAFLVAGSDKGDTKMKSEALNNQEKFKQAAQNMETEVAKLVSAAKSGDFNAIKAQFGAVGKSCKKCHEQFRSR